MRNRHSQQLPLRDASFRYWLPTETNRFVTYEDSDLGYLQWARLARPAGRASGRTTREILEAVSRIHADASVFFIASDRQECERLEGFAIQLIRSRDLPRPGYDACAKAVMLGGGFLKFVTPWEIIRGRLRGEKIAAVICDHYVRSFPGDPAVGVTYREFERVVLLAQATSASLPFVLAAPDSGVR